MEAVPKTVTPHVEREKYGSYQDENLQHLTLP